MILNLWEATLITIIVSDKNYSSKKIVSDSIIIFEKVNGKISELISCSVKDFEILNHSFKNYYSSLDIISEASKNFINFLLSLDKDEDFIHLNKQEELTQINLNDTISIFLTNVKNLEEKLNFYLLILNNLNQDLSTIRLLFTNLKFDPFIETDNSIANNQINNISQCLTKFATEISSLHSLLSETIKFTDEGFISALDLYTEQFDNIKDSYKHISLLSRAANKYQEDLTKLEDKRKLNTSEIITNLQFQDILRQKIEHVQEAHEEISEDLKKVKDEKDALNPEKLFKIRDITTLQSAQLIHSNQEYQTAVETILNKISELNILLNKYQSIWNHFCKPERGKLQSIRTRLREQISILDTQSFSLSHIVEKFDSNLHVLADKIKMLHNYLEEGKFELCSFPDLQEIFQKLENRYSDKEKHSALKQLRFELNKFEVEYKKLNKELENFKTNFTYEKIRPEDNYLQDVKVIKEFSERNSQYFTNSLGNKIDDLFKKPIKIESNNSFNIKEVTYYKVFEKEINKIISLLDDLLVKINVSKNDIDLETLEHLRENYTMDSERKVHDLITQQELNKSKTDKEKDEDDIEFF